MLIKNSANCRSPSSILGVLPRKELDESSAEHAISAVLSSIRSWSHKKGAAQVFPLTMPFQINTCRSWPSVLREQLAVLAALDCRRIGGPTKKNGYE